MTQREIIRKLLADAKVSFDPKNKWVRISPNEIKKQKLEENILDLIENAYRDIGGHHDFMVPRDVTDSAIKFWKVIDIDDDPDIDGVLFGKIKDGIKFTGIGHDGGPVKRLILKERKKMFDKGGSWAEVSGTMAEIFLGNPKYRVPYVASEKMVRKLLKGKEIEWIGKTSGKPGEGWYIRNIAGKPKMKIIVGVPNFK